MTNLSVRYMGIELKNPLVVGACSLSKQIDTIKQVEDAGAGALVIKSLFEEQVQLEHGRYQDEMQSHEAIFSEAMSMFPNMEHGGPEEHLHWISETKKAVSLPLFASLNAVHTDVWVDYAARLEETGVDGLELNFYSLPLDPNVTSADIERQELEAFASVREKVKIPIAVKLHPNYTGLMNVVHSFDRLGANAVVLFNKFFQPDINIADEGEHAALHLSDSPESLVPLRWTALLHKQIKADITSSTGIMDGKDAIRMLLAGATTVQLVSTLYKHKLDRIGRILHEITSWMDQKGYETLEDFRGKASKANVDDPWAYERGQYIKLLLGFD